jgi:hypothetical protein
MAPPVNDDYANRTTLTGASGSVSGTTAEATTETGELIYYAPGPDMSVWYEYTPAVTGTYKVHFQIDHVTYPTAYMAVLFFEGSTSAGSFTNQFAVLGSGASSSNPSEDFNVLRLVAGTSYKIKIFSVNNIPCTYSYTWEYAAPPANDDVANAEELVGVEGDQFDRTCIGATPESDDILSDPSNPYSHSYGYATVWFKYIPTVNGLIRFRTHYPRDTLTQIGWDLDDAIMGSYKGSPGSLEELAFVDFGGTITINGDDGYLETLDQYVEVGTTYYFGVSQYGGTNTADIMDDWGGNFNLEWWFHPEQGIVATNPEIPDPGVATSRIYPSSAGDIVVPWTNSDTSGDQRLWYNWQIQWSDFDNIATVGDESKFFVALEKADGTMIRGLKFKCSASSSSSRSYNIVDDTGTTLKNYVTGTTPYVFSLDPISGSIYHVGNGNDTAISALYGPTLSGYGSRTWSFFWLPTQITGIPFPPAQIRFGQFGSGTTIPLHWTWIEVEDSIGIRYKSDFDVGAANYSGSVDDWIAPPTIPMSTVWNTLWQGGHEPPTGNTFTYQNVIEGDLGVLKADTSYDPLSTVELTSEGIKLSPGNNADNGGIDLWYSDAPTYVHYDPVNTYGPDDHTFEIGLKAQGFQSVYRDSNIEAFGGIEMPVLRVLFQITDNGMYIQFDDSTGTGDILQVSENWFYRFKVVQNRELSSGFIPGMIVIYMSADRGTTWETISVSYSDFTSGGRGRSPAVDTMTAFAYEGDWSLIIEGIYPATTPLPSFSLKGLHIRVDGNWVQV